MDGLPEYQVELVVLTGLGISFVTLLLLHFFDIVKSSG